MMQNLPPYDIQVKFSQIDHSHASAKYVSQVRTKLSWATTYAYDNFLIQLAPLYMIASKQKKITLFFDKLIPVWFDRFPTIIGFGDVFDVNHSERAYRAQTKVSQVIRCCTFSHTSYILGETSQHPRVVWGDSWEEPCRFGGLGNPPDHTGGPCAEGEYYTYKEHRSTYLHHFLACRPDLAKVRKKVQKICGRYAYTLTVARTCLSKMLTIHPVCQPCWAVVPEQLTPILT